MSARQEFDAALGTRLRQAREASGRTGEDIAREARQYGLPWHRTTVSQIEQGKRGIGAYELTVLSRLFGVTLAQMVDNLPTPDPVPIGADEATTKAAARLGRSPGDVDSAARRLWGHSLTEERESRLGDAAKTRADQARRGHVTRQLIDELRADVGALTA